MKIINSSGDVLAPVTVPGSRCEEPGSDGESTQILHAQTGKSLTIGL